MLKQNYDHKIQVERIFSRVSRNFSRILPPNRFFNQFCEHENRVLMNVMLKKSQFRQIFKFDDTQSGNTTYWNHPNTIP